MDIEYFPQRKFLPTRQDHLNHFYRNFEIKKKILLGTGFLSSSSFFFRMFTASCEDLVFLFFLHSWYWLSSSRQSDLQTTPILISDSSKLRLKYNFLSRNHIYINFPSSYSSQVSPSLNLSSVALSLFAINGFSFGLKVSTPCAVFTPSESILDFWYREWDNQTDDNCRIVLRSEGILFAIGSVRPEDKVSSFDIWICFVTVAEKLSQRIQR